MERAAVIKRLADGIEEAGSARAWAREAGCSAQYVCDVLRGRREPGETILKALGLERVVIYRVSYRKLET